MTSLFDVQQLEKQGNYQAAFQGYRTLMVQEPKNMNVFMAFAQFLIAQKEYTAAESALNIVEGHDKDNFHLWALRGKLYMGQDKLEEAGEAFDKALKLNKKDPKVLQNYAHFLRLCERYDDAISYYNKVIKQEKMNVSALYDLGLLYHMTGQYDDALKCFRRIMNFEPTFIPAHTLYATCLHDAGYSKDLNAFYEKLESSPDCPELVMHAVRILQSIHHWLESVDADDRELLESANILTPESDARDYRLLRNTNVFRQFLMLLHDEKQKNGDIYAAPNAEPVKYVIGDSHVLPMAHLKCGDGRVLSQLVMGCKAYHLASEDENNFQKVFKNRLAHVPEGADLLVNAGEIDCRVDEGFVPYFKKHPDVDEQGFIADVVRRYVVWVMGQAKGRNVTFVSVPAPYECEESINIVKIFNTALQGFALGAGASYLDTYSQTVGDKGLSNQKWHLDYFHLRPSFYAQLLNK